MQKLSTVRRGVAILTVSILGVASGIGLGATPAVALGTGPNAYVLRGTNAAVIDTGTRTPTDVVAVGSGASDTAFSADGTRAYISSTTADAITVIDTATNAVVDVLASGDAPGAVAATPLGDRVLTMLGNGDLQILDVATGAQMALVPIGSPGDVAVTPSGDRAYVAAGAIREVDLATNTITSTFGSDATTILLAPDATRAYVANEGGVGLVDLVTRSMTMTPPVRDIFSPTIGRLALSPTGDRLFIGAGWTFVDTGYGAGFFPGSTVSVLDTASFTQIASIPLGSSGAGWSNQHLPSGIAVTPDRSAIYVGIPRLSSVAVIDYNTLALSTLVPMASPGQIDIAPDPSAVIAPYLVDAVDDVVASTTLGGLATPKNALANDRMGGVVANTSNVSLEVISSSDAAVSLGSNGSIQIAPGGAVGNHVLNYRICSIAEPGNCDSATVFVTVRESYPIDAVDDVSSAMNAGYAPIHVLANDTLNGAPATTATVKLTQVSTTHPGVALVPNSTYIYNVFVSAGTPAGVYELVYQICENASPVNCDRATASITVVPNPIDAVDDAGATTRSGGTAVANVLANDRFKSVAANTGTVTLTQIASSSPNVRLDTATGAVTVTAAAALGTYTVDYRICEKLVASNCDTARVTVSVTSYLIDAVNDSGRGASKYANTIIANVLTNDRFATGAATLTNVRLSRVSMTPANKYLKLDVATGRVYVSQTTSSGIFTLVYKICEKAQLTNCDTASVTVDLSGGL